MIKIENKEVGEGRPCYLIAEVAQAHDGSIGMAHAFIGAAADAGVDAIKFQTHIADAESTLDEKFRIKMSGQDQTRYDYWKRMEFSAEEWAGLSQHACERGLTFLSSVFSVPALEMLHKLGVPAWKFGSGEVATSDLLDAAIATGKPLLISTGMSGYAEIEKVTGLLRKKGRQFALFQCTSRYPNPISKVGLNVMDELRRFDCPVGLSDHSGSPFPALLALARGADLIELHVTFSRQMYGPDVPSSVTFDEMKEIVAARDAFRTIDTNPVDKDAEARDLAPIKAMFGKSVALARDLPAGTTLGRDMLTLKKPGTGIPAGKLGELVGRRLARAVPANRLLTNDDIEAK
ncbi:MAG: N-acetylneuraminate synthase family protein [Pseudolabrys sp.]